MEVIGNVEFRFIGRPSFPLASFRGLVRASNDFFTTRKKIRNYDTNNRTFKMTGIPVGQETGSCG